MLERDSHLPRSEEVWTSTLLIMNKRTENRECTDEEVVSGAFLKDESEWWMRREGKERLSQEYKLALGWIHSVK